MIYLDTSVALAQLLAEDRRPPESLWSEELVASRLLEYELWTRINARNLAATHGANVRKLLARITLLELSTTALARATEPFPLGVRTLDAMHLASALFLQQHVSTLMFATYDLRLADAALAVGLPLYPLPP